MEANILVTPAEAATAQRRQDGVIQRGRSLRRRRHVVATGLGAVAVLGLMAVAANLTSSSDRSLVRTTPDPTPSSVPTPLPAVPPSVIGTEQKVTTVPVPFYADNLLTRPFARSWDAHPGTVRAFSVDGAAPFVTFDATPLNFNTSTPSGPDVAVGMYEQSDASRGAGYGILSSSFPLANVEAGAQQAVFLGDQWPNAGQQTYTWAHLPAGTAFVTYTWRDTHLWQRPTGATGSFVMPRPTQFDGPTYADWHTAPIPVLRALDANGNQLAQANAPRVGGDDFLISPDAPSK